MSRNSRLVTIAFIAATAQADALDDYLSACRELRRGESDAALGHFAQVLEQDPGFERAYRPFHRAAQLSGKPDLPRTLYESWLAPGNRREAYGHYGFAIYLSDGQEAAAHARKAINLAPGFLPAFRTLADIDLQQKKGAAAEAYFESLRATSGDMPGPLYGLGTYYLQGFRGSRDYQEYLDKARSLFERADRLRPDDFDILSGLNLEAYRSHNDQYRVVIAQRMVDLSTAKEDADWQAYSLFHLGNTEYSLGRYDPARRHLEQALRLILDLGRSDLEPPARATLGLVLRHLGDYPEAAQQSQEALKLYRALGDTENIGRSLGILAQVQKEAGNYAVALENLAESLRVARQVNDRGSEAAQLSESARIQGELGYTEEAIQSTRSAIEIARSQKNNWQEGRLLTDLGDLYAGLGNAKAALDSYANAARLAKTVGDQFGEPHALARAGALLLKQGRYQQADAQLRLALEGFRENGARTDEGAARVRMAELKRRTNRLDAASQDLAAADEIAAATATPFLHWSVENEAALQARRRGQLTAAAGHYNKAIDTLESIRSSVLSPDEKAAWMAGKISLYRDASLVLSQLHAQNRAKNYDRQAFEMVERGRARSLLDMISESRVTNPAELDEASRERLYELNSRFRDVQEKLKTAEGATKRDPENIRTLRLDLFRADRERERFLRTREREILGAGNLRSLEPTTLPDFQAVIDTDEAALYYSLGPDSSLLFAVTGNTLTIHRLPPSVEISVKVSRFRSLLVAQDRTTQAALFDAGLELYRLLIAPAEMELRGKRKLAIIADGPLNYLPFEALLSRESREAAIASQPFLIRQFAFVYAPSATIMTVLRQRAPALGIAQLLAYGDPAYARSGPRPLSPLHASGAEVAHIAKLYPQSATRVGAEATEADFKSNATRGGPQVIHLALHSVLNERQPRFSALAFASPLESAGEDGLLQVHEILSMKLSARLVVLSACKTALGTEVAGEGLRGLTQAFLAAGAQSIAASLWNIEDSATADLMMAFHDIYRKQGSPSDSLRRAQLSLLESGRLSHPYYWAGFVIVGAR